MGNAHRSLTVAAVTVTTAPTALYTAAQAHTPGLCEVILDPEGAIAYSLDAGLTYANGTRLAAGEKAAIPVGQGARVYAITASSTAVVRCTLNAV